MPTDLKQKLKEILNCPTPETLRRLLPDIREQDVVELHPLLMQYRESDVKIKKMQNDTRRLSRLIGEAKKQGANMDALLADMRNTSSALKNLKQEQQKQEDKLLNWLPAVSKPTDTEPPPSALHQARQYPESRYDSEIYIAELLDKTEAWNRYVEQHAAASLYHLAQWREVIKESFGHEARYFYAQDKEGTVKGILPLIRLKSRLFGDFMVSMPYFNYGGAIGDHPAIEEALIKHANQQASDLGLDHIEYRDDIAKQGVPERTDKVNMILPLPVDEDTLWQSFTPKLRSQIRRPQRETTHVERGNLNLLDDFYHIFARNMRDLGTPVYSKSFFATILRGFPHQSHILIVYLADKPVAGAFLIGYKATLEIPWASTIRSANHLSVNMLMYWEVLRFAIQKKYRYFDFGRSSVNSGTYKFKKQWGAQPKKLYWHYWLNQREMPSLNPSNPKYKLMINIWKKLPIWLTKLIGPTIVRNLP